MNLKKQLACLYTNYFFSGLRITDAVWVALLAARGFSLWEIGLAESVYHIVSLLCEVPSGMAADLLGRKRALVAGGILAVLSSLLMAFAPGLFLICAAMGLNALSNTMFSGTDAALTYDSLKQAGQEERYLSVAANRSQIGMLASALGSLASILRRFLRFSGFYLVSALFSSISTLAMLLLKEPVVTEAQAARSSHSLRELPGQFAQLVRDSAAALHGCPLAAKLIAADAVISVPCYLTKMFLQQRLVGLAHRVAFSALAAGRCGLRGRYRDRPTGTSPHPAAVLHGVCPAGRWRDLSGRRGACMGRHSGHDAGAGRAGSLAAPCRPASQCPDLQ